MLVCGPDHVWRPRLVSAADTVLPKEATPHSQSGNILRVFSLLAGLHSRKDICSNNLSENLTALIQVCLYTSWVNNLTPKSSRPDVRPL